MAIYDVFPSFIRIFVPIKIQMREINKVKNMNRKFFVLFLSLFFCCFSLFVQAEEKSELHQRAESAEKGSTTARSLYIRAYEDYVRKGQVAEGIECGVQATALYYKMNEYKEAFDLLRNIEQSISSAKVSEGVRSALRYKTTKERLSMYMRLKRGATALEQLNAMERFANASGDEAVKNDFLYNKAIYYYTFGMNAQGNAAFKEMSTKLTATKEFDKIDDAYQALIASARRSGSAGMIAESYSTYLTWKDSVNAQKKADELGALKKQIADNEAVIADKDSSLSTRQAIIIGLCVLIVGLVAALVVGALILLRFIMLTRKQKNVIKLANDSNALKAKFISNISAQLEPTLKKLDNGKPEAKALLDFCKHIQTLSELENTPDSEVEQEDTPIQQFCEEITAQIRGKVKEGVTLKVDIPKMTAPINKEYVSHILLHLLNNAVEYTANGGSIYLDFKKRGPHKHQFIVSDTGCGIPEEKREDIFKPFLEVKDLTKGDGLGLPICKQMALKMNGDLEIDPQFTKGTRFVLNLFS